MDTNENTNPGTPNAIAAAKDQIQRCNLATLRGMINVPGGDFTVSKTSQGFQANGQSYTNAWAACAAVGF